MADVRERKLEKVARLSHVDEQGRARMVDVGEKPVTRRVAIAAATVCMQPATLRRIRSGQIEKGEVLAVARVAGIQAAKRTSEWIPLCHPLPLDVVSVDFKARRGGRLEVRVRAATSARTGVEMEALTAASAAALTVYDMCKAVDRGMTVTDLRLLEKRGGRSGVWKRGQPNSPRGRGAE